MVEEQGHDVAVVGGGIAGLVAGGAAGGLEGGPEIGYVGGLVKCGVTALRAAEHISTWR
jgi:fumarate reductase flavoprotein subunit